MTEQEQRLELEAILERLNEDERGIVLDVSLGLARRMMTGRTRYGALELTTDGRDWTSEALEESIDGSAYLAAELRRRRMRAG